MRLAAILVFYISHKLGWAFTGAYHIPAASTDSVYFQPIMLSACMFMLL